MKIFLCLLLLAGCASQKPAPRISDIARSVPAEPGRSLPGESARMIVVGGVELVDLPEESSATPTVGDRQVLDVAPTGNPRQWRITGRKRGVSSVIFLRADGSVLQRTIFNVTLHELSRDVLTIRRLLGGVEGISVEAADDHVVIDGRIMDPKQLDRILKVQHAYGSLVVNLVEIDPRLYEERALRMETEIQKQEGGKHVRVIYLNDTYLLVGRVERPVDRDHAEAVAQLLLPEMMARPSFQENLVILGARKYSIRNLIEVAGSEPAR